MTAVSVASIKEKLRNKRTGTCGNVKGVCTGGFGGVKKLMEHIQCDPVHIFRVVEKGN